METINGLIFIFTMAYQIAKTVLTIVFLILGIKSFQKYLRS